MIVNKRWYILHTYSGAEKKIAEAIREQALAAGMQDEIDEVIVPTEDVVELRRGRRVSAERKFFPGYILIRMAMNEATWNLVTRVPKVTGFLGVGKKPQPISQQEADRILRQVQEGVDNPRPSVIFEIGEQVRVCDGPFLSFNGVVEDVDEEKARLKVTVFIFGRATPVDLEYAQVEKL